MGGRRAGLITAGAVPSSAHRVYNGMRNRRDANTSIPNTARDVASHPHRKQVLSSN